MLILSMRTNKRPDNHIINQLLFRVLMYNKYVCGIQSENLSYYETQFQLCLGIWINFEINIVINQRVYWMWIFACMLILQFRLCPIIWINFQINIINQRRHWMCICVYINNLYAKLCMAVVFLCCVSFLTLRCLMSTKRSHILKQTCSWNCRFV